MVQDHVTARRVVRGGAWYAGQDDARATYRNRGNPDDRYRTLGLRVVRVVRSGAERVWRRVVRGGAWLVAQDYARASYRNHHNPVNLNRALGLRVVRSR